MKVLLSKICLPLTVAAVGLLSPSCGTTSNLDTPEGLMFIQGRVNTLSFLLVKELPDEAPAIQAAAEALAALSSEERISLGELTAAFENSGVKELDSEYAPILLKEVIDWYNFISNRHIEDENEQVEQIKRYINAVATGLRDGISEWRLYEASVNR